MLDKTVMLIGAALFLSAGISRYWLLGRSTRAAMLVGFAGLVALLAFSFADLRSTLHSVIPTADGALLWRYLTTTAHGGAVKARVAFGLALAALLLVSGGVGRRGRGPASSDASGAARGTAPSTAPGTSPSTAPGTAPRTASGVAFVAGSIGLLSTFSVLSHGAVMGGWWPLVSDLVHFLAAGTWAGGVVALVLAPVWAPQDRDALLSSVTKLSTMGLAAVIVLTVTGTLNGLLHVGDPASFLASGYASALVVKVALVVVTVVLAALNRFSFLPRFRAGGSAGSLRSSLRIEAVLLVAVLVATGWLTTTAVPHDMTARRAGVNVIENAQRLIDHLRR
ncbi:MAG TPA: CopD family protein [Trueperaceae bacterium]|nr:CopD family protein [Trueperaceae bacterium]